MELGCLCSAPLILARWDVHHHHLEHSRTAQAIRKFVVGWPIFSARIYPIQYIYIFIASNASVWVSPYKVVSFIRSARTNLHHGTFADVKSICPWWRSLAKLDVLCRTPCIKYKCTVSHKTNSGVHPGLRDRRGFLEPFHGVLANEAAWQCKPCSKRETF